jgi:hypothetical protein
MIAMIPKSVMLGETASSENLTHYVKPSETIAADGRRGEFLDLGVVDAGVERGTIDIKADVAGRFIGDQIGVSLVLSNSGSRTLRLETGENTCSCARMVPPKPDLPSSRSVTINGRATISMTMGSRAETSTLVVKDAEDGREVCVVRVVFEGVPQERTSVVPPAVSFGTVLEGASSMPIIVEVQATAQFRVDAKSHRGYLIDMETLGVDGCSRLSITPTSETVGVPGRHRVEVILRGETGGEEIARIPVETTIIPVVTTSPPTVVLTSRSPSATARIATMSSESWRIIRVEGTEGVKATNQTESSFSVELAKHDPDGSERIHYVVITTQNSNQSQRNLRFPVIVR